MKHTGRNALCSCHSGKKYKQCCGQLQTRAINAQIDPDGIADAFRGALEHHQAGRLQQAEAVYRQILQIDHYHPDVLHLSGVIAYQRGNIANAIDLYRKALGFKPDYAEIYNNLCIALTDCGELDEAIASCRKALTLKPQSAEMLNSLGNLLNKFENHVEAEVCYRQALTLKPDSAFMHYNLGQLLRARGRFVEAEAGYRRAIALEPGYAEALYSLAGLLCECKRVNEAEAGYRRALTINSYYADAKYDYGFLLLSRGQFEEGWRLYEARCDTGKNDRQVLPIRLLFQQWNGQSLAGKSLLMWSEQGYGDEIQLCRYSGLLKQMGAKRITLVCKAPLKKLFQSLEYADAVIAQEETVNLPYHDYWTLMGSVPLHCGTRLDNIPASAPYLHAPAERIAHWAPRIPAAGARIGLVWKGSDRHKNDANRSIPHLSMLAPLWRGGDTLFVSLQKGQGEDEAAFPPDGQPIVALGADILDFADTAAIVMQLDLVICVDTAIAHLAGALNKPCWVMLPENADWRWLRDRDDSPWYSSLRLFRQTERGDWAGVIDKIRLALIKYNVTV